MISLFRPSRRTTMRRSYLKAFSDSVRQMIEGAWQTPVAMLIRAPTHDPRDDVLLLVDPANLGKDRTVTVREVQSMRVPVEIGRHYVIQAPEPVAMLERCSAPLPKPKRPPVATNPASIRSPKHSERNTARLTPGRGGMRLMSRQ